jgi:bifunctional non-homologous end joining protein LigD
VSGVVITHAERVVFPEVGITKGDVVEYYAALAPRILAHVGGRPLTMKRYPKGIGAPGFFQKNVPPHYPKSIERFEIQRKEGVTVYPVLTEEAHLPYVANQGAIEIHVPCTRVDALRSSHAGSPDRIVIDLDPPPGGLARVRSAARLVHAAMDRFGLPTTPVATGSKGYHIVSAIQPTVDWDRVAITLQRLGAWLAHAHPAELTIAFRVKAREGKVFVDWLRNVPQATVVAPYSLRARPRAPVATPIRWDELDAIAPDHFTLRDRDELLARADPLAELARAPIDAEPFCDAVDAAFGEAGIELETFDRFRS